MKRTARSAHARASGCPGAGELVAPRLPYLVFVKIAEPDLIVLNVVHTARRFPQAFLRTPK